MSRKRKKKNSNFHFFKLVLFTCIILILFTVYLFGKVNIDVVLIKNDALVAEKKALKERIDELKVTLNKKRGYKRIVKLAREQGLIFIPPSRIAELEVTIDSTVKHPLNTEQIYSKLAIKD